MIKLVMLLRLLSIELGVFKVWPGVKHEKNDLHTRLI